MSLKEDIANLIAQHPGLTDADLTALIPGGPNRHQQVNARCRQLAGDDLIRREKLNGRIRNFPANSGVAPNDSRKDRDRPRGGAMRPPGGADGRGPALPDKLSGLAVTRSEITVSFVWHSAGELSLDSSGKLAPPALESVPGIYRFRFPNERRVYVGESANLRRRMQNYRTPDPQQKTSLRMNGLLKEALAGDQTVLLETATDIRFRSAARDLPEAALSSKTLRVLAENAALLLEYDAGWTPLNKAD